MEINTKCTIKFAEKVVDINNIINVRKRQLNRCCAFKYKLIQYIVVEL